jgi:hypothetical protein
MNIIMRVTLLAGFLTWGASAHADDKPNPADLDFFEKKIRPVLVEHCYGCHSVESKKERGGLLLDNKESLLKGGDSGSAIVPGKPNDSLLIKHVRWTGDRKMPPKEKLPDAVIGDLEKWISLGAPDPRTGQSVVKGVNYLEGRKHWAYQPLKVGSPPSVKQTAWPKSDLDRYILARIEAKNLSPAADAAKQTLLRRLSFDLTGLPPTPEQVDALDKSSLEDVVDRLLKSKEFGVHWARHWLDGVRYNLNIETVDHYRHWVIGAFNDDLPYDQFIIKQLAGDLLPSDDPRELDANLIATQLLVLNRNEMDLIEGTIEVVGQQFLGVSLNCAKCHDHKFDAFSQHDYYALAGVFTSTAIGGTKKGTLAETGIPLKSDKSLRILACQDNKVMDTNLLLKGDPKQKGELVPRRLPLVFAGEKQKPLSDVTKGSGRLEVAQWIASKDNPLTARVMVNRVWQRLFGQGLVATPNDFGTQGEKPTHPELLDALAERFIKSGWSVKSLIHDIVLSRTYQQSTRATPEARSADLDNALWTRMPMRRLQYEQIADNLHHVAGRLSFEQPTPAGKRPGNVKSPAAGEPSIRAMFQGDSTTMRIFDGADPELLTERREASVTGPQMLFFLNNQRVIELAGLVAQRADKLAGSTEVKPRVTSAFRILYGRSPTPAEIELATAYLKNNPFSRYCHVLMCANEFIYLD